MIVLTSAKSVDPDEMPHSGHSAAFHLGLHCVLTYGLEISSIQRVKACIYTCIYRDFTFLPATGPR